MIYAQRFTGDLQLRDGDRRFKVSWEDGRVVAAESAAPADSAGRVALSAGLVTSTELSRALDAMARSPGTDLLEVLSEMVRLNPEQVTGLKRRLLALRAARAFALPDATYVLDNARSLRADPDVPSLDARWLVYFGLRTHYTVERLERELGGLLDRGLRLADDALVALPAFAFGEAERPVMDRLSMRAWTPRQLLDACAGMEAGQVLSVVYALVACDCLEPSPISVGTMPPPIATGQPAPTARGTETRPPPDPTGAADAGGPGRRGRGTASSAPAVPGAAEHARLAHGTVRRLLFPGHGTSSPPVGDALAAVRARRASTLPPDPGAPRSGPIPTSAPSGRSGPTPTSAPSGRSGPTPTPAPSGRSGPTPTPAPSGRSGPTPTPAPSGRSGPTPTPAPETGPTRRSTTGTPPVDPPTGSRPAPTPPITPSHPPRRPRPSTPERSFPLGPPVTRPAPVTPDVTSPRRDTDPSLPATGALRSRGRETSPPPVRGPATIPPAHRPPSSRPHSTTVPPILRRSHSTTGSLPPDAVRGAAAETRRMISEKIKALERSVDHYAILGVSQSARADEIRAAYFSIAKRIHPDRLRAVGVTEVGPDAQRLFARINQAFGVLSDPQRRAEYALMVSAGGEEAVRKAQADAEEKAGRVLRAEETFRRGEMALRRSQFEAARALFEEAVELNGDEAEYHALLAWSIWLAAPDKNLIAVDVQKRLAQALAMSPQCVPAHFYCGQVAKHSGQIQAAVEAFRTVIDLEPEHSEANLELRVLRGRLRKK